MLVSIDRRSNPFAVAVFIDHLPHVVGLADPKTINRSSLRLHNSHIALGCSRFRKAVGELVVLSGNIPEPNLDVLSHVSRQHAVEREDQP
jgi:hypothetical protein